MDSMCGLQAQYWSCLQNSELLMKPSMQASPQQVQSTPSSNLLQESICTDPSCLKSLSMLCFELPEAGHQSWQPTDICQCNAAIHLAHVSVTCLRHMSLAHISGTCLWHISLAHVSGTCLCHMSLAHVSGICLCHMSLARISGTYLWHMSLAYVSGICLWHVSLARVSGTCLWHSGRRREHIDLKPSCFCVAMLPRVGCKVGCHLPNCTHQRYPACSTVKLTLQA